MILNDKTLIVFHSYKTSFATWKEAGILDRELKLYRELKKRFKKIIFVSYSTDLNAEQVLAPDFKVLVNYNRLHPMLYAAIAWIQHRRALKEADIFRVNQMSGFLAAGPAKLRFWKAKLVVRCGFMWSRFQVRYTLRKVHPKKVAVAVIEWLAFILASRVIVTSFSDKRYIMRRYRVAERRITVIRNLIDTETFRPLGRRREPKRICAVGRLEPQKNYQSLIEALTGTGYELHIYGDGSQRNELGKLAKDQNVTAHFHGTVPNNQLPRELATCSAFTLASHYEGNPKSLMEAMACGLPVVASNIEANRDIIIDEENGLLAEPKPESLRIAIERVMVDSELTHRLGFNAQDWIRDHASLSAILKQEIHLYESL